MHNTHELYPASDYVAVGSTRRVYLIISQQVIPLWTWLLKLGLHKYQGYWPTYTHALLAVVNTTTQCMYMYEMDFYNGQECYVVDYDALYYDATNERLTLQQETFYGSTQEEVYTALDVTQQLTNVDVEHLWWCVQTDVRLTPCTLAMHLTDKPDKKTWTCSGMVQALMGMDRLQAYLKPLTPDQLLEYCRLKQS
jgi:hypothetical protein